MHTSFQPSLHKNHYSTDWKWPDIFWLCFFCLLWLPKSWLEVDKMSHSAPWTVWHDRNFIFRPSPQSFNDPVQLNCMYTMKLDVYQNHLAAKASTAVLCQKLLLKASLHSPNDCCSQIRLFPVTCTNTLLEANETPKHDLDQVVKSLKFGGLEDYRNVLQEFTWRDWNQMQTVCVFGFIVIGSRWNSISEHCCLPITHNVHSAAGWLRVQRNFASVIFIICMVSALNGHIGEQIFGDCHMVAQHAVWPDRIRNAPSCSRSTALTNSSANSQASPSCLTR